jgi:hypothetical protein
MIRSHGPILKTVTAALLVFAASAAPWAGAIAGEPLPAGVWLSLFLGILYTHFFEHWSHRVALHRGIAFLDDVRRNHLEHHRRFHGTNFRTHRPADLNHIAGRFWVFPLLYTLHYVPAMVFLPPPSALAFMLGCLLHYLIFEVSHWATHVADNPLDRVLDKIPIVRGMRALQIEHHRIHHETPVLAFNFNPPYLGDVLSGLMPPSVPLLARRRFLTRPMVQYGAAAAVGLAAIGLIAVIAFAAI